MPILGSLPDDCGSLLSICGYIRQYMNIDQHIKKTYLFGVSIVFFLCLLALSGLLLHFFFWQKGADYRYVLGKKLLDEQVLIEGKIEDLIQGIESDFLYCRNGKHTIGPSNSIATGQCDQAVLKEMVRMRISSLPLDSSAYLMVSEIKEENTQKSLGEVPLLIRNSLPDGLSEYWSSLNQNEMIREVINHGGSLLSDDALKNTLTGDQIVYARHYPRFKWIILYGYDVSGLKKEVKADFELQQRLHYKSFYLLGIPILFFLSCGFLVTFGVYLRISFHLKKNQVYQKKVQDKSAVFEKKVIDLSRDRTIIEEIMGEKSCVYIVLLKFKNNGNVIDGIGENLADSLGYACGELLGRPFNEICTYDCTPYERKEPGEGEIFFQKKDGEKISAYHSYIPILGDSGEISSMIIIAYDIEEYLGTKKSLERIKKRLLQSQKLESIGILSSGIAHDFNNVLSSIVGYAELLKEQLSPGTTPYNDLEQILLSTNRAANLVKQIHAYSRRSVLENSTFEPGPIVKETLKMLRSSIPSSITIKQDLRVQDDVIFANTTRFHQLFMNLCTNAFQAMELDGGVLTVKLKKTDNAELAHYFRLDTTKSYVKLTVADTGCGMSESMRKRLVEAEQRDKVEGEYGEERLADDFVMIKELGGAIWFTENQPQGTIFHVLLPANDESGGLTEQEKLAVPFGTETLLFVDDEPDITQISEKMLSNLGYTVFSQDNGEKAFQFYKENKDQIDLIITDQSMPGMTGAELTEKIRQISDIPVILITGYSAKITEGNWRKSGVNGLLMKPFRKREIGYLIKKTLAEHRNMQE